MGVKVGIGYIESMLGCHNIPSLFCALILSAQTTYSQTAWEALSEKAEAAETLQKSSSAANWEKARVAFEQLALELSADAPGALRCEVLLGRGRGASQARRPIEGIPFLKDAEQVCRIANEQVSEARAASALGTAHLLAGQPVEAEAALSRAQDLWARVPHPNEFETVRVINNLANANWLLGKLEKAESAYRQVASSKEKSTDRLGWMYALLGLGNVLLYQGEFSESRDHFDSALRLARELKSPREEAQGLNSLGYALFQLGRNRDALDRYREALVLWKKVGDKDGEAMSLTNIAWLRLSQRDWKAALEVYEQALPLARVALEKRSLAYVLHGIGNARLGLGEHEKARLAYEESLQIKRGLKDRFGEAATLAQLGELAMREGRYTEARTLVEQALSTRQEMLDVPGEIAALALLARLDQKTANSAAALERIEAAVHLLEKQRASITTAETRASFFTTAQDYYRLWIDMLPETPDKAARSFAIAERRIARALLDELEQERRVRGPLPAELARLEKRLEAQSKRMQAMPAGVELQAARREMLSLLNQRDAAQSRLLEPTDELAPVELARLQNMLPADTAVLEFSLGGEKAQAWVVTRRGIELKELGQAKAIRVLAQQFLLALAEKRESNAGEVLSRLILRPLQLRAGIKKLVVVPDGELRRVPWSALPHPQTGAELIETYEVTTAPSASVWVALQARRLSKPGRGLMVADPEYGTANARYAPLPFSREEMKHIVGLAGGRVEAISGAAATAAALVSKDMRGYGWLHFAAHAEADTERGELGALVLAGPSALRVYEISQWKLNGPLVVLNACETALGEDVAGEGAMSLARAFLSAGARSVAATMWRVSDRSGAELMRLLYERWLVAGLTPSSALRQAQLALRTDSRFRKPYYWAAMQMIGPGK